MKEQGQLRAQIDLILQSGVLGSGTSLEKLLLYLAERAYTGKPAKEIEVALDVFGRDASFDVSQDALVRVYMHKLRTKLDQFYAQQGNKEVGRIVIPRGQYLLELESNKNRLSSWQKFNVSLRETSPRIWVFVVCSALLAAAITFVITTQAQRDNTYSALANSSFWSPLLNGSTPITLVVGDIFIFSEVNREFEQIREIRDFSVNSAAEFNTLLHENPDLQMQYRSFGQTYLPAAAGDSLITLLPLLNSKGNPIRIMHSSGLKASDLQSSHIVYLGYFNSLQVLDELVFGASRFVLHPNGSVLVDRVTGDVYAGEGILDEQFNDRYFDYALVSSQRIAERFEVRIFAAARSPGLRRVVDLSSTIEGLAALTRSFKELPENYEILVEVSGTEPGALQNQVKLAEPIAK